jgi:hypothetical protein
MEVSLQPGQNIFRPQAVRRYNDRRVKSVLPRLISPHTLYFLWALLGLILIAGVLVCMVEIPIHTTARGVVVKPKDSGSGSPVTLAILLPPKSLPRLKAGQLVFFQGSADESLVSRPIREIEPRVLSPEELKDRFDFSPAVAATVNQPVAVALVEFEPIRPGVTSSQYSEATYEVQVATGTRPLVNFLRQVH